MRAQLRTSRQKNYKSEQCVPLEVSVADAYLEPEVRNINDEQNDGSRARDDQNIGIDDGRLLGGRRGAVKSGRQQQ